MSKSVERQKGPIKSDERTSKMMTHPEKVREAEDQAVKRRDGQTLKTHEPKSSRK